MIPGNPNAMRTGRAESRRARIFAAAANAKAGKCALTGLFMCFLFLISGSAAYLTGGLILIFIAGSAFRKQRMPKTLFGQ